MYKVIKLSNIGLMVMLVNRALTDNGNPYKEYAVQTNDGVIYDVTPYDMCNFLGMYYEHLERDQNFLNKPNYWYAGLTMASDETDYNAMSMLNATLGTDYTICVLDANGRMEFE